ncbi:MAG: sulfite exporter TauE/SafE family protein, partial [Candidatus Moranbacteria bacterium]|nr:sulfite exporter TauE/SafE family protein [Candidatus Moranbacteria bacterium]
TNKMASFAGTSMAIYQYSRKIRYDFKLLAIVAFFAFIASRLGAKSVSMIDIDKLKPLVLILLIVVAAYVFFKKDLGKIQGKKVPLVKQMILGSLIGFGVGFYDGFFGPGTGSFLVLGFVLVLGFEFVAASAYSKVINGVTNISAIIVFASKGNFLLEIAIPMALCNATGSIIGSRMALHRGNSFVRMVFLIVVSIMIARYAYEVFWQ